ncbi:ATP-grasp domain-containing protein, partial [Patescibacteria group bacterium]|nr:ATP-grasp domain-containing protein [Patescibacteria group bacterium]
SGLARYIAQHENGLNTPRSIVFKLVGEIKDRLSEFKFPVVIKTDQSKMGQGVGLARNLQEIIDFIKKHSVDQKNIGFVLRQYIPNDGDYRVNVIDGRAVTCLKRTPQKGEFRSNISLGGNLSNTNPNDVVDVCADAEKIAKLFSYDIAGVDIMVHKQTGIPYILEINRAPDLNGDTEVSGINIAKLIVDLYENRYMSASHLI